MLTVHHLGLSQSERIVWLCEELGLDYAFKRYDRRADNRLAPDEYFLLGLMDGSRQVKDLVMAYFLQYKSFAFQNFAQPNVEPASHTYTHPFDWSKPVDLEQFINVVRSIEGFWLQIVKLPSSGAY